MKCTSKLILMLLGLSVSFCAAQKEEPELSDSSLSFRLTTGGPLSLPDYDELSPQLVQHPDGKLTLLFVSNRPCNNGTNCNPGDYSIFLSRSEVPYNGGPLPAFTTPLSINNGYGLPIIGLPTSFNIAAVPDGNNAVWVYFIDSNFLFKYTVSVANPNSLSAYPNDYDFSEYQLLGVNPYDDNKIYAKKNDHKLYYFDFDAEPLPSLPFMQGEAQDITSIAALPRELAPGKSPFFASDSGAILMGSNTAMAGLVHLSLGLTVFRDLMAIEQIAVMKANSAGNEVFLFAGRAFRKGDISYDLYAVKNYSARELWRLGINEYANSGL